MLRHLKLHKAEFATYSADRKLLDDNKAKGKRSASSSSSSNKKKPKQYNPGKLQPTIDKFLIQKEPILSVCGAMVVENGYSFASFKSDSMQVMIALGKKGAGDTSGTPVKPPQIRDKVQEEAEKLRKELQVVIIIS